ncbi:hypothetical protein HW114_08280 [Serratia symbiotica]|uniref:hypothetical protein n=1 Tax=Serratia symbiotica TaxID=138074 RepID=UPI001889662E|nr:hypothetical protein [Serratia symbiotica]MBF1995502.1 hypothetical protein [Serratia symbiotica]
MSKSGFDADDLSLTLARFANKRRHIVYDKAKLKSKAPKSVALSSAADYCGATVLNSVASIVPNSDKSQEEIRSPMKYSWEKQGFFRHKDGFN